MNIVIQGSRFFNSYEVFMKAMNRILSSVGEDKEIVIYALGSNRTNNFVTGFVNMVENSMKVRGRSIKFLRRPPIWAEENIATIDHVIYLANRGEKLGKIVGVADLNGVEATIFRH